MLRRLIPKEEFRRRARKLSCRTLKNSSASLAPLPIRQPSWETDLYTLPNRSLPDTLQLLALHRPSQLRVVERIARAFAEAIDRDLLVSNNGEAS